MKKITSIILLITIIFSCFAFSGCELFGGEVMTTDGEQTTTTTTTSSTTSTTTQTPLGDEPVTIEFEHGDNFTEDDIEFVKSFHGYRDLISDPILYSFSEMIDNVKSCEGYLYYVDVDIDNPYYICAYIDIGIKENLYEWLTGRIDVTKYVWYKFETGEDVPVEIGELSIGWAFHMYDAIITKDVGNGTDLEHKFRYYSLGNGAIRNVLGIYDYMLIHCFQPVNEIVGIEEKRRAGRIYEGHTTSNEKNYLQLWYCSTIETDGSITDGIIRNEKKLENYYDVLYPYFERVEELDFDYTNAEGEVVRGLHYGIDVDMLYEVLFRKE